MKTSEALSLMVILWMSVAGCSTAPAATVPVTPSPPATAGVPVAIDWTTTKVVAISGVTAGSAAPDGSRVYSHEAGVIARDGSQVGDVQPSGKIGWRWADDSRHLCAVYPPGLAVDSANSIPTALFTTLPGSAPAQIAFAGYDYAQAGPRLMACSFTHGTATVGETCITVTCETWTIDLLTHQVVGHLRLDGLNATRAVVSPDGTLLALSGPTGATIYETVGGKLRATLTGVVIDSFSGDSRLVLVEGGPAPPRLLDWQTGKGIAVLPPGQPVGFLPEPGGSRIAVAIVAGGATQVPTVPSADIVVVSGDGSAVTIARGVVPFF